MAAVCEVLQGRDFTTFCRKWNIKELTVFGSALRDDFRADSDVDFLVEFEDDDQWDLFDHIHMRAELSGIVGRGVDYLTRYALDHDSNPLFRESVLARTETVYAV